MRGRDERSRRHHGRGRRRQHLVDQRGLEGSFNAAADQVTQRDLEHMLTCGFTWEEGRESGRLNQKGDKKEQRQEQIRMLKKTDKGG